MEVWVKVCLPIVASAVLGCVLLGFAQPENRGIFIVILAVASTILAWLNYRQVSSLRELTRNLERLADGDLEYRRTLLTREDELGRIATASDRISRQLRDAVVRTDALARGELGVAEFADRARRPRRIADVDLPATRDAGPIGANLDIIHNNLRRLTVQAYVLGEDDLGNSLLNDELAGEIGDAFAGMVTSYRDMSEHVAGIANGDLSSFIESEGALASSFNAMVIDARTRISDIVDNTMHFSTAAEEILAVLRDQELAAAHQASSVEETQRTMETLLSSAKRIAESAQTVFKSAERTQANNRLISDRAAELKSHTERIGEILESIKEIADRSDLLALNASLEGLRAGEAGKGFTLVAAEMRRLAENIKGSVGNVKELLSDIRESALSSAMAIEEGTFLSERTTESALKITLITQQQQSGTEQVTQSMEELSHLINQGLAGTRQVTTAASELATLSDAMRSVSDNYLVEGTAPRTSVRTSGTYSVSRNRARLRDSSSGRTAPNIRIPKRLAHAVHETPGDSDVLEKGKTVNLGVSPMALNTAQSSEFKAPKPPRRPSRQQKDTPVSTTSQEDYSSPTVDVSEASDELRELFEGRRESSSAKADSSIEDTFNAIERQLDDDED